MRFVDTRSSLWAVLQKRVDQRDTSTAHNEYEWQ